MKVSTEIDNNFGYEKITQLEDNCNYPFIGFKQIVDFFLTRLTIKSYILIIGYSSVVTLAEWSDGNFESQGRLQKAQQWFNIRKFQNSISRF